MLNLIICHEKKGEIWQQVHRVELLLSNFDKSSFTYLHGVELNEVIVMTYL
jgi:hypothetical protein